MALVHKEWGGVDKHIDAVYYYPTEYKDCDCSLSHCACTWIGWYAQATLNKFRRFPVKNYFFNCILMNSVLKLTLNGPQSPQHFLRSWIFCDPGNTGNMSPQRGLCLRKSYPNTKQNPESNPCRSLGPGRRIRTQTP